MGIDNDFSLRGQFEAPDAELSAMAGTESRQPGALSLAECNEDDYVSYLDGLDLSPEQARELVRIVWDMMRMCIEMNVPAESWGQIVETIIEPREEDSLS